MAQIVLPFTYQTGQTIVAANEMSNLQAIVNQVNGNIDNTNLASTIAITDSHLNQITSAAKVSGTALTGLASIPSGAGVIPAANLIYSNVQYPYVCAIEQESSGTSGGSGTGTTWTNRILNTLSTDTQGISSLTSNQLTLPAGTYITNVYSVFNDVNCQIRLFNVTASTVLLIGLGSVLANSGTVQLGGLFTLSTSSAISVQYWLNSTGTNALGVPISTGTNEIYTIAQFTKIQ